MRDGEAFLAITVVLGSLATAITIFAFWQKERSARRRERHELLRSALQHPQLDEITRAELLRSLAREQGSGTPLLSGAVRTLWFAAGWLMFVIGGGLALLDVTRVFRTDGDVAAVVALVGFAMLSLPIGLRELMRRDGAAAAHR